MKNKNNKNIPKTVAILLTFMILSLGLAYSVQADGICEKALVKCLVDAAVVMIFSGPETGAAFALGCLNGYTWCLRYYLEFENAEA